MVLDVILPTFNREALLERTLESLRAAALPEDLEVRVLVVDNASTDGTSTLVRCQAPSFEGRLHYLFVPTPGKPHALNAGIAATDGDLVGLIDDDEEVDAAWFECIGRHFASHRDTVDFIGGKCLPLWGAPRPAWLGKGYLGVIGWVDPGPVAEADGRDLPRHPDGRQRRDPPRAFSNAPVRTRPRSIEPAPPCSGAKTRTCTTACSRSARAEDTCPISSSTTMYPQRA